MEWIRLAVFFVATTYLPGRALATFLHESCPPAGQVATGLALSLILCALPASAVPWVLPALTLASAAVLWFRRVAKTDRDEKSSWTSLAFLFPGVVLALLALAVGPFRDVSFSNDGALLYRTDVSVGGRSAGVYPVLSESALLVSCAEGGGDPFVSGEPLLRLDPRRSYLGLAWRFSGVPPYVLVGKVVPAVLLLCTVFSAEGLFPDRRRARGLFAVFLFGSGLSFLPALLPVIRSWPFRVWVHLSESTGFVSLLTDPGVPLLLFLSLRCRFPLLMVAAILLCETALALPLLLAAGFYSLRAPLGFGWKLSILTATSAAIAFSESTPFAPLLRAVEYSRLDHLMEVVSHPFGSPGNFVQTLATLSLFLVVSLGIGILGLFQIVRVVASRDGLAKRGLYCWTLALVLSGLMEWGGSRRTWSVGLLLLAVAAADFLDDALRRRSRSRQLVILSVSILVSLPGSFDYLRHYHRAPTKRFSASDNALGKELRDRSRAGDPVLHRPNRSAPSIASHVSFRPSVLCYYGRSGSHDAAELEMRSRDLRFFFDATDVDAARTIVEKYGVRFVVVERDRPLSFGEPTWLRWSGESENLKLYEVN